MREFDKKNKEALEQKLKNKALCWFYRPDRSVVNLLLTVFTDKKKDKDVLWKYVKYKGRRYYLSQHVGVPVLCLHFFEGREQELGIGLVAAKVTA
jgi:hypothetical protein